MTDAPNYASPAPAAQPAGDSYPGKTMGIIALILAILPFQLIGLILGIVALTQSKKAGRKNGFAVAAIIISIVLGLIILGFVVAGGIFTANITNELLEVCQGQPAGTPVEIAGQPTVCPGS